MARKPPLLTPERGPLCGAFVGQELETHYWDGFSVLGPGRWWGVAENVTWGAQDFEGGSVGGFG